MSRIAIITVTGNPQVDHILAGVIGHLNSSGGFDPIEEFKQIPLISGMTPEVMNALSQETGVTPGILEIEVADEHLAGFKATVANNLLSRWISAYDEALANIPDGFARSAVNGEIAKVRAGCVAAIGNQVESIQQIHKPFENVNGLPKYSDVDDLGDGDGEIVAFYLTAIEAIASTKSPWLVPAVVPAFDELYTDLVTENIALSSASGRLAQQVSIFGDSRAMVDVLNQVPLNLQKLLVKAEPPRFFSTTWHAAITEDLSTDDETQAVAPAA